MDGEDAWAPSPDEAEVADAAQDAQEQDAAETAAAPLPSPFGAMVTRGMLLFVRQVILLFVPPTSPFGAPGHAAVCACRC